MTDHVAAISLRPAPEEQAPRSAHKNGDKDRPLFGWGKAAAAISGAALGAAALYNQYRAREAEQANPPRGRFVEVDGVRLHHVERGSGPAVVLLHGNGAMIQDWEVSGLIGSLAGEHRIYAFDRPGFGHSSRPRARLWTASAQAALMVEAFRRLGIERPLIVGHSWGAQTAAALAIEHPDAISGAVLMSGYYFPSLRGDVIASAPSATPVLGDMLSHTINPLLAGAIMPMLERKLFSPAPVPPRWTREFPTEMALRPSQMRAEAEEAAMMPFNASRLAAHYPSIKVPVTILAGTGDEIVDTTAQSQRLHGEIAGSRLELVAGAGHMVHHSGADAVVATIREARRQA
jgi:pimeloyl-ACP methyl ester carboxylesterase